MHSTMKLSIQSLSLSTPMKTINRYRSRPAGVHHRFSWYYLMITVAFVTCLYLSLRRFPSATLHRCSGRYIYVHDLPPQFNSHLVRDCATINPWTNMCPYLSNAGLGTRIADPDNYLSGSLSWYATHQFLLEVIFHHWMMQQYECRTADAARAAAVYVPYYPGLDIERHLWEEGSSTSARDAGPTQLARWLRSRPEWAAMGGKDHFMVSGRVTWEYRRQTESESDWGNKLFLLPEIRNMTTLLVEGSPWHRNDVAVPYPTYFHPIGGAGEVAAWQERVRAAERRWLFSFAGAPRKNQTSSIRSKLIEQCQESERCNLLDCTNAKPGSRCHSPLSVMQVFERSNFCLQPQGDTYTRRSAFDAMVAGCIPVFFHPGSAYVQYRWHLPGDYRKYSVFIPEEVVREGNLKIQDVLAKFSKSEVRRMREEVIGLIPGLIYRDPRAPRMDGLRDAFDVAVDGVIERVKEIRKGAVSPVKEQYSWKEPFLGRPEEHEWSPYFSR